MGHPRPSCGQSSSLQQSAIEMSFHWRADDGLTLNAAWFFRGSGPVLLRNPILYPDIPSRTDKVYHDVELMDGSKRVKQHPYRMNLLKQQTLREKVQYWLDNDFIEPRYSVTKSYR